MSTERLYYNDCYGTNFDAAIVELSEAGRRVYLNRTYFYPTSGGQPHDWGSLSGQAVVDVVDEGDRIAHLLREPFSGNGVQGAIDWRRRYDHMQQHSGQHLLSAVCMDVLHASTLSFHLGPEVSTIELGCKSLSTGEMDRVEARANELAWAALPIHVFYREAAEVDGLRKPTERTGRLRIIEIVGIDRSACGGTHVRSTAELAPLQLRGVERVRGNVRIEFVCGRRAVERSKKDFRLLAQLAKDSGTAVDEVAEAAARVRVKLGEAEKQQRSLIEAVNGMEAAELYRGMQPDASGTRWFTLLRHEIDERAKGLALALIANSRTVVIVVAEAVSSLLFATSTDSQLHAGNLLRALLAKHGGRGGGSAQVAQGTLPNEVSVRAVVAALRVDAENAEKRAAGE